MNVLFKTNMTAVRYQAQVFPQKSICPISQTSLTSKQHISIILRFRSLGQKSAESRESTPRPKNKFEETNRDDEGKTPFGIDQRNWSFYEGGVSYHKTILVYSTRPATTTVKMRPGTRPKTEYEYGNDMMAKQIYSEKSNAAV
jgi:hypothetical protein